jgi:hypothetical protein
MISSEKEDFYLKLNKLFVFCTAGRYKILEVQRSIEVILELITNTSKNISIDTNQRFSHLGLKL